jgi:hypothetical protein
VWVTAFAAGVVLSEDDRRPDPVLRWWRVREPCPVCSEQMTLCGEEPGLLQGCAPHGYWIDADTVAHTRLGGGIDHAALEAQRSDDRRADAERERLLRIEQELSRVRAERERAEAQLSRADRKAAATERPRPVVAAIRDIAEDTDAARRAREDGHRREAEAVHVVRALGEAGRVMLARLSELERRCARLEQENARLGERLRELEAQQGTSTAPS